MAASHISLLGSDNAEPGMLVVGADGRVAYANDRFRVIHAVPRHLKIVGAGLVEMGRNLARHQARLGLIENAEAYERACFSPPEGDGPSLLMFESGALRIAAEATPLPDGGCVLVHRVAQHPEALRRVEAIERRYADVMEAFADWYWETGPDHRFTYVGNPVSEHVMVRADEFVGYRRWEVPGVVEPPDSDFWRAHRDLLERREPFRNMRYERRLEDGSVAHFSIDGKPVYNSAGLFTGYRGVGREVSHIAEMERQVAEGERRYRDLVEGSIQGVIVHVDSRIVFANPMAAQILGYDDPEELKSLESVHKLFWPGDRTRLEGYRQARLRGDPAPEVYELRARRRDGSMIWIENRARTIRWNGRPAVQSTMNDVSQRKLAREKLEESKKRLAGILDIAPEAIMSVDEDYRIRLFNKGAQKLFGYAEAEMLGQPVDRLIPDRFRGGHESHIDGFARSETVSRPMSRRGEITGLRRDGTEFPAEASISKLQVNGRWLFNVTIQDVTERKRARAELVAAREAAEAANRAKSEFLWNMSHELRTPLNAIIGFSELIRDQMFGPIGQDRYLDYARDIHASGAHLLSLINEILDLSRIEAGIVDMREEPVDLARMLYETVRMLTPRAEREDKTLQTDIATDLPMTLCDAKMMRQILINLIANAVQYTEKGGSVRLTAALRQGDDGMDIAVADDGVGIAPGDVERIFHPFQRASQVAARDDSGYGLGLPLAKRFCDLHQIALDLDSAPDEGTTVTLHIPGYRVL